MFTRAGRSLATLLLAVCVPLQARGQPAGLPPGAAVICGEGTPIGRAARAGSVAGSITTSWDDSGHHMAAWMPRFVCAADFSWNPRAADVDRVVTDSETCRWWIEAHAHVPSIHPVELLAAALGLPDLRPVGAARP